MSDKIISISVDVTMLDKARFIAGKKPNKAGKIPQYVNLDLILRRDGPDQFGNAYFLTQKISKEERLAGKKPDIIGNGKVIVGGDMQDARQAPRPTNAPAPANESPIEDDDVPF